ncbi:MAG: UMP kinase [Thermodesulfobacteriota bacterium]
MASSSKNAVFKRILLKLSGESLLGKKTAGIDPPALVSIAADIKSAHQRGVQIAIVIGGGNIFRGLQSPAFNIQRVTADYMGMTATVINALALMDALKSLGFSPMVMSALQVGNVVEPLNRQRAIDHLEGNGLVIFAGGTGNPYVTTDTAATLRAIEIDAQAILKATKVDGVYDCDPVKDRDAKFFQRITYEQILQKKLKAMDLTAISLAMEHDLPIIVFNLGTRGNLDRILAGHQVGTLITGEGDER